MIRAMNDRPTNSPPPFEHDEDFARQLDRDDPLAGYREQFEIPIRPDGQPVIYLAGNSLGLMPKAVRTAVGEELDAWAAHAVDGHFEGKHPWYPYHEMFRASAARLVGGLPGECVMMNGLTVNLHLMMVSFYRPTPQRYKILIEDAAFPSDVYAVQSQLRCHGFDPADALLVARPRDGEHLIRHEDIQRIITEQGDQIALILFGGVNYYTGQVFDLPAITRAGHAQGCVVGFDLAHAAGNIPLRLHDWDVDFACWCTYKYLNCGPGSVAGCFVHERHAANVDLPRFAGWWGNDPATRFRMHLNETFVPVPSADAWQLSNPPILSLAALRASLAIFDEVGMDALREKSLRLTGYLRFLLDRVNQSGATRVDRALAYDVITPREHGCQLSILVHAENPKGLQKALQEAGVVSDFRPPNVVRVAPVPLYNTFHEVWRFARILDRGV
jgi:kynureninase